MSLTIDVIYLYANEMYICKCVLNGSLRGVGGQSHLSWGLWRRQIFMLIMRYLICSSRNFWNAFPLKKKYLATLGLICSTWNLSLPASLQLWLTGSRTHSLSSSGAWAWLLYGLWDLSSPIRDRTCVPCIERWILLHYWTTTEVPETLSFPFFRCPWLLPSCISGTPWSVSIRSIRLRT